MDDFAPGLLNGNGGSFSPPIMYCTSCGTDCTLLWVGRSCVELSGLRGGNSWTLMFECDLIIVSQYVSSDVIALTPARFICKMGGVQNRLRMVSERLKPNKGILLHYI
jgi:hypothetical protein